MKKDKIDLGLPSIWTVLLVAFIVLKVAGVTTMSWWWVFAPLLIPLVIVIVTLIAMRKLFWK